MSIDEQIQAAAERGDVVIGADETVKGINGIETVVLASNTPPELETRVREAADGADADIQKLSIDNVHLGSLCGEPFAASVVGMR